MITLEPYRDADRPTLEAFMAGIQETERAFVPALKTGAEIAAIYTDHVLGRVAARDGMILIARGEGNVIGAICAWITEDDDMLLREGARRHAYVSDLFIVEGWRRRGVARRLLEAVEAEMIRRGCREIRIDAKASNRDAVATYHAAGFVPYVISFAKPLAPS
jgi:ribosomal protein S18 acetylase RimI-like enzyme